MQNLRITKFEIAEFEIREDGYTALSCTSHCFALGLNWPF